MVCELDRNTTTFESCSFNHHFEQHVTISGPNPGPEQSTQGCAQFLVQGSAPKFIHVLPKPQLLFTDKTL